MISLFGNRYGTEAIPIRTVLEERNKSISRWSASNLLAARQGIEACLARLPNDVPVLLEALENGRINGIVYYGKCSCLKGTLGRSYCERTLQIEPLEEAEALDGYLSLDYMTRLSDKLCSIGIDFNIQTPEERFFDLIRTKDTPENNLAAALAHRWISQWYARYCK